MRNKLSRGTSLCPSFRVQPCGSLCCYAQWKQHLPGSPHCPQQGTRADPPLTTSAVGTTNSTFTLNNSQGNEYKCVFHHYHQYRFLVLCPYTQKTVPISQIREDKKMQNNHSSYSISLVDIKTSNNNIFILNSSLKIISVTDPHSIFVTL